MPSANECFAAAQFTPLKVLLMTEQTTAFLLSSALTGLRLLGPKKAWEWILADLHAQASKTEGDFSLSWFFVVQRNPKPPHTTFLTEVGRFFDQTALPIIKRDRGLHYIRQLR